MAVRTGYFVPPGVGTICARLKTLDDAAPHPQPDFAGVRAGENETDPAARDKLLTIVVVGGGPTAWNSPERSRN